MKKLLTKTNLIKRRGFTLMEILLVTALLAIISGASLSLIYWQMRVQAHVNEGALVMNKLINTQMLMRKVLRSISPASLSVDLNHDKIKFDKSSTEQIDLFEFSDSTLSFNGSPIMENVIASFSKINAEVIQIDDGLVLHKDCKELIKIELATIGREGRDLHFLVRPRGM